MAGTILWVVAVSLGFGGLPCSEATAKLYWSEMAPAKRLRSSNRDGTGATDVVPSGLLTDPRGIAVDASAGEIYWADQTLAKIYRSVLNSGVVEELASGMQGPEGLALDSARRMLYWTDARGNKVQRLNLTSNIVEDVCVGLGGPRGIAVDHLNGKLYWSDLVSKKIERCNLDRSGREDFYTLGSSSTPLGLYVDGSSRMLYWAAYGAEKVVQRRSVDGGKVLTLASSTGVPVEVALDTVGNQVYFADWKLKVIRRVGPTGGTVQTILSSLSAPAFLVVADVQVTTTATVTTTTITTAAAATSRTRSRKRRNSSVVKMRSSRSPSRRWTRSRPTTRTAPRARLPCAHAPSAWCSKRGAVAASSAPAAAAPGTTRCSGFRSSTSRRGCSPMLSGGS